MSRKRTIITFVIGFVIFIFGYSVGSTKTIPSSVSTSTPVKTAVKKSPTQPVVKILPARPVVKTFYAIGETATLNGASVVVTKITKSHGSEFESPKSGNEFVIITVIIKNSGNDQISYNPYDFKMQNSKGQITDEGLTTIDSDTQLASGDLAKGGTVTGTVVYEQPINDPALVLKYTNNIFSNDGVNFKLN